MGLFLLGLFLVGLFGCANELAITTYHERRSDKFAGDKARGNTTGVSATATYYFDN